LRNLEHLYLKAKPKKVKHQFKADMRKQDLERLKEQLSNVIDKSLSVDSSTNHNLQGSPVRKNQSFWERVEMLSEKRRDPKRISVNGSMVQHNQPIKEDETLFFPQTHISMNSRRHQ